MRALRPGRSMLTGARTKPRTDLRLGRATKVALAFVLVLIALAAAGEAIAPKDPFSQDLMRRFESPSADYVLGTDAYGRDTLSRLIVGARLTLLATLQAVATAIILGVPPGLIAGFRGGFLDAALSRMADALMSIPTLLLAIAIVGILGSGLTNAMLAVGVIFAPRFYRVARGAAASVRSETYMEASRAIGCSTPRLIVRHLLPNASGPLIIQTTYSLGLVVIAEASLSFLGLGVKQPDASWGGMTREAFGGVAKNGFPMIPPIIAILLTILAFSTIGDGFRDALTRGRSVDKP